MARLKKIKAKRHRHYHRQVGMPGESDIGSKYPMTSRRLDAVKKTSLGMVKYRYSTCIILRILIALITICYLFYNFKLFNYCIASNVLKIQLNDMVVFVQFVLFASLPRLVLIGHVRSHNEGRPPIRKDRRNSDTRQQNARSGADTGNPPSHTK
jgi:hypothetical protein